MTPRGNLLRLAGFMCQRLYVAGSFRSGRPRAAAFVRGGGEPRLRPDAPAACRFWLPAPNASKEGTACRLIEICSRSPPGDRR
jgi:hypothetical protein